MKIKDLLNLINQYSEDCVCDGYDELKGRKCTADFLKEDLVTLGQTQEMTKDPEMDLIVETVSSYSKKDRDILFNALCEKFCLDCRETPPHCFCGYSDI